MKLIENILEEDEIIQDIKINPNSQFIEMLSTSAIRKLIDYATKMPKSDDKNVGYKYPFNATEILCCDNNAVMERIMNEMRMGEDSDDEEDEKDEAEKENKEEGNSDDEKKKEENEEFFEVKEDERKEHTRNHGRHDIDRFVAKSFGKRFGGRQRHYQRNRTEHVEQLYVLRIVDIVFEIISDSGILHGEHDKRHDTDAGQHYPCLVHKQIFEVLEHIGVLFLGLRYTLFGGGKGDEEERNTEYAEQADRVLVSLRLVDHTVIADGTQPFDEIECCTGNDELTDVRRYETIGVQSCAFVTVIRHDC